MPPVIRSLWHWSVVRVAECPIASVGQVTRFMRVSVSEIHTNYTGNKHVSILHKAFSEYDQVSCDEGRSPN